MMLAKKHNRFVCGQLASLAGSRSGLLGPLCIRTCIPVSFSRRVSKREDFVRLQASQDCRGFRSLPVRICRDPIAPRLREEAMDGRLASKAVVSLKGKQTSRRGNNRKSLEKRGKGIIRKKLAEMTDSLFPC